MRAESYTLTIACRDINLKLRTQYYLANGTPAISNASAMNNPSSFAFGMESGDEVHSP